MPEERPCSFHPARMTLVSCSRCDRPICPDDMHPAPVGIHCPVCAGKMREGPLGRAGYRARARVEGWPLARLIEGASVTQAILGVNVIVFVLMLLSGAPTSLRTLLRFGALPPVLLRGQWWRLFTSMFVHVGFAHLLFNMFALAIFGRAVEARFGKLRFTALYLSAGLLGAAASLAFTGGGVRAGASGAVFGILGAWVAFFLIHRSAPGAGGQLRSLLFLVGINLFIGASLPGIDNAAHVGGLVAGLIIGGTVELSISRPIQARALVGLAGYAAVLLVSWYLISANTIELVGRTIPR